MGFYTVYKKQKEYRYMKKTIKRKQKLGIRIGVGCALVITVILLAVQGVSNLTKKPVDTSEGIAYIKGKESADAKFIKDYSDVIKKIQKAMPDAHIFVNAVFPVQESAVEKEPALANIADYNEKLEAMCEKKQIGYIDNSDIIEDEYYEEDGIHFKANFYPIWAEKMAEVATL